MLKKFLIGALVAFLVPGVALANKDRQQVDVSAGTFAEQRQKVDADLADGETYSEIAAAKRAEVVAALNRMETLLDGRPVSALREAEKVDLMNDQELINTHLTQAAEDSRLVCRREPAVGSRLQRSQCLTVAERRRKREDSQDALNSYNRGFGRPAGEP